MAKKKKEPIKLEANILKIVRTKAEFSTVLMEIPQGMASKIPIGKVLVEIQVLQTEINFGKPFEDEEVDEDE